ncbi:MAG: hypothetical protein LBF57_02040 [Holosporaceae bacterium]|jgi:hypothetical protein|nr:hypothetical protein [Holosporaceae bacterium]
MHNLVMLKRKITEKIKKLRLSRRGYVMILVAVSIPIFLYAIDWAVKSAQKSHKYTIQTNASMAVGQAAIDRYNPGKEWNKQELNVYSAAAQALNDRAFSLNKAMHIPSKLVGAKKNDTLTEDHIDSFFIACNNTKKIANSQLLCDQILCAISERVNNIYVGNILGEVNDSPTDYLSVSYDKDETKLKISPVLGEKHLICECPTLKKKVKAFPSRCDVDIIITIPTNHAANTADNSNYSALVDFNSDTPTPITNLAKAYANFLKENFLHICGVAVGIVPYSAKVSLSPWSSGAERYTIPIMPMNNTPSKPYIKQAVIYGSDGNAGGEAVDNEIQYGWGGTRRGDDGDVNAACPIMFRQGTRSVYRSTALYNTGAIGGQTGINSLLLSNDDPTQAPELCFQRMNMQPCYLGHCNILAKVCEKNCPKYLANPYYILELTDDIPNAIYYLSLIKPIDEDKHNKSNFLFLGVQWAHNLLKDWTKHPSTENSVQKLQHPSRDRKKKAVILVVNAPDHFEPNELTYLGFNNDNSEIPMFETDTIAFSSSLTSVKGSIKYSGAGEYEEEDDQFLATGTGRLTLMNKGIVKITVASPKSSFTVYDDNGIQDGIGTYDSNCWCSFDGCPIYTHNWHLPGWMTGTGIYNGCHCWLSCICNSPYSLPNPSRLNNWQDLLNTPMTYGKNFGHNFSLYKIKYKAKRAAINCTLEYQILRYCGNYDIYYPSVIANDVFARLMEILPGACKPLIPNTEHHVGAVTDASREQYLDPCIATNENGTFGRADGWDWGPDGTILAYDFQPICYGSITQFFLMASDSQTKAPLENAQDGQVCLKEPTGYRSLSMIPNNSMIKVACSDNGTGKTEIFTGKLKYNAKEISDGSGPYRYKLHNFFFLGGTKYYDPKATVADIVANKCIGTITDQNGDTWIAFNGDGRLQLQAGPEDHIISFTNIGSINSRTVFSFGGSSNDETMMTGTSSSGSSASAAEANHLYASAAEQTFIIMPEQISDEQDINGNYHIDLKMTNVRLVSAEITNRPYKITIPTCSLSTSETTATIATNVKAPLTVKCDSIPSSVTFYNEKGVRDCRLQCLNGDQVGLNTAYKLTGPMEFVFAGPPVLPPINDDNDGNNTSGGTNFYSNLSVKKVKYDLQVAEITNVSLTNQVLREYVGYYSYKVGNYLYMSDGRRTPWGGARYPQIMGVPGGLISAGSPEWITICGFRDSCIKNLSDGIQWQPESGYLVATCQPDQVTQILQIYGLSGSTVTFRLWASDQVFKYMTSSGSLADNTTRGKERTTIIFNDIQTSPYMYLELNCQRLAQYYIVNHGIKTLQSTTPITEDPLTYDKLVKNEGIFLANYNNENWICFQGDGELHVTAKPSATSIQYSTPTGEHITKLVSSGETITIDPSAYNYEEGAGVDGNTIYKITLMLNNIEITDVQLVDTTPKAEYVNPDVVADGIQNVRLMDATQNIHGDMSFAMASEIQDKNSQMASSKNEMEILQKEVDIKYKKYMELRQKMSDAYNSGNYSLGLQYDYEQSGFYNSEVMPIYDRIRSLSDYVDRSYVEVMNFNGPALFWSDNSNNSGDFFGIFVGEEKYVWNEACPNYQCHFVSSLSWSDLCQTTEFGEYTNGYEFLGVHRVFFPNPVLSSPVTSVLPASSLVLSGFTLPINMALQNNGYQITSGTINSTLNISSDLGVATVTADALTKFRQEFGSDNTRVYIIKYGAEAASLDFSSYDVKSYNAFSENDLNVILKEIANDIKSWAGYQDSYIEEYKD